MEVPVRRVLLGMFIAFAINASMANAQTYSDLFDYCAATGTADYIDPHVFAGEFPYAKARAASQIGPGFDYLKEHNFLWRCFKGTVMSCVWTNQEICGRVDISRVPTKATSDFCRRSADTQFIPLAVTGHQPTMYAWGCRQGVATITQQLTTPDEQGYPPEEWKRLTR
jgi:hypothetical protein